MEGESRSIKESAKRKSEEGMQFLDTGGAGEKRRVP
jgi:hypothetical protein